MDVFSCRVRPGGHIFHEVNKHNVTAAEVAVLRFIHNGQESVYSLVRTATIDTTDRAEYARLSEMYGADKVRDVYGPVMQARLPQSLDEDFEDAVLGAPTPNAKKAPAKATKKAAKVAPVPADDDEDDDLDLN